MDSQGMNRFDLETATSGQAKLWQAPKWNKTGINVFPTASFVLIPECLKVLCIHAFYKMQYKGKRIASTQGTFTFHFMMDFWCLEI